LLRARLTRTLRTSLCAVGIALAGCGSNQQLTGKTHPSRENLQSIFQEDPLLDADPGGTLDLLRHLGVDRVRVSVLWARLVPDATSRTPPANFDPSDPAAYPAASMTVYDTIVREAASRGIGLYFTLTGPAPLWAAGGGAPAKAPYSGGSWKPSARAFAAFVHAIGTRYSGHFTPQGATKPLPAVRFWSIWNEPNYGWDLAPQAIDHSTVEVSPRLYRGLLDSAWGALHATGHGADTILIGETAPRGVTTGDNPGNFSGMVPLRFVRALYCVDGSYQPLRGRAATLRGCPQDATDSQQFATAHPALFHASGFADHPYPQGALPPNQRIAGFPDYADLAALPNLESTLDRSQAAYGSHAQMPIYSTEFGYQTKPPGNSGQVDPATAATYLNWSEYLSWLNPRLVSYDQYLLVDPPQGNFPTGLEFSNRTPKPAYAAFRMPLWLPRSSAAKGQPLEVWGCVRPAPFAATASGATQQAEIQLRASGQGAFRTIRTVPITDPHGYFDVAVKFDHSGEVRLAWTDPHGTTFHSRIASVAIH
jgi:hypothetical protein